FIPKLAIPTSVARASRFWSQGTNGGGLYYAVPPIPNQEVCPRYRRFKVLELQIPGVDQGFCRFDQTSAFGGPSEGGATFSAGAVSWRPAPDPTSLVSFPGRPRRAEAIRPEQRKGRVEALAEHRGDENEVLGIVLQRLLQSHAWDEVSAH